MKNFYKFLASILTAVLLLGIISCSSDDNGDDNGVSFQSFSPALVYVDNNSSERLIAFKGSLDSNNLISGIPANAVNHGLKKDDELFNVTQDFILVLITEDQYNQNKANLAAAAVFTQLHVVYRHGGISVDRVSISDRLGGSGSIIFNNPTEYNIEIRIGGTQGEILTSIPPYMINVQLKVNAPDDYILFPILKRFNPTTMEMHYFYPVLPGGLPYFRALSLNEPPSEISWNLSELVELTDITSGGFYLRVINNSGTGVQLNNGDVTLITSLGISLINPESSSEYFLEFPRNPNGSYPDTRIFNLLRIGTSALLIYLPSFEFELDYIYSIEVTGEDPSNLVLGSIIRLNKIDFNWF